MRRGKSALLEKMLIIYKEAENRAIYSEVP